MDIVQNVKKTRHNNNTHARTHQMYMMTMKRFATVVKNAKMNAAWIFKIKKEP